MPKEYFVNSVLRKLILKTTVADNFKKFGYDDFKSKMQVLLKEGN